MACDYIIPDLMCYERTFAAQPIQVFNDMPLEDFRMRISRRLDLLARALRKRIIGAPRDYQAVVSERDRWKASAEVYEHAFRTTAADRDRLKEMVSELADPLDVGFFRLDLGSFGFGDSERGTMLSREWIAMLERGAYAELMRSILDSVPIRIAHPLQSDYFRPFAIYYLASMFAALRDSEQAHRFAKLIEFDAPPDSTDLLPYDIRQATRLAFYQQQIAIKHGHSGAAIISLPRSASGFLAHGLSYAARVPVLRLSVGEAFCSVAVPRWVRQIARGGATTHEHLAASPMNLAVLREAGLRDVWVQLRDPRDAAFSQLQMQNPVDSARLSEVRGEQGFVSATAYFSEWIDGWVDATQRSDLGFGVHFVRFEEVTGSFLATLRRILAEGWTTEIDERAEAYLDTRVPINFRKGTGQEWRSCFTPAQCERAWEAIPPGVRSFLDLKRDPSS